MNKRVYKISAITICMLFLILDTKTAVTGAFDGVELCIRVLIPSLFPFFLISILLTDLLTGSSSVILRPLGKLLKIPVGAESLFLIGILGGYPVGAQILAQSAEKGTLSKGDVQRMTPFCNNAGPAFIFGVISSQFPRRSYTWLIWCIILLSSIITAMILPGNNNTKISIPAIKSTKLTQAMKKCIQIMAGICGWVVIFRVLLTYLERWFLWLLPDAVHITVQILLELANGCIALNEIEDLNLRFIICVFGLCIGGLCVLLQTLSVSDAIKVKNYIPGKFLQTGIGTLLAILVVILLKYGFSATILVGVMFALLLTGIILSNCRRKNKIKCRIPLSSGV